MRQGRTDSTLGGALFYCSDIQAKFGARGYPREASWVLGWPFTISNRSIRSGAKVSLPVAPLLAWGYPAYNPPEQGLTL